MQSRSGRGPGNPYKHEFILTDEQRLSLGTDRWFTVKEIAAVLGVSEQTVRAALQRGALQAFKVALGREKRPVVRVRGLRVVAWRDTLAGISDPPETDYEPAE